MSKEKLLLVGAGGFGRMVAEQAMLHQYDCAFVDDGQSVGVEICGIPVVGGLADLPELRKEYGAYIGAVATLARGFSDTFTV